MSSRPRRYSFPLRHIVGKGDPQLIAVHNPFHHTHGATVAMLLPPAGLTVKCIRWMLGALTVRQSHAQVAHEREIAYTTVLMTCVQLAEKGLPVRAEGRRGMRHVYTRVVDERTFVTSGINQLLSCMARDYPDAMSH